MKTKIALTLSFTIFILLLTVPLSAQMVYEIPYDKEEEKIKFQEVVTTSGLTPEQIHQRAYEWMKENFRRADAFIRHNSLEEGIMITGQIRLFKTERRAEVLDQTVEFKLLIEARDGRYRFTFYDFHVDRGYRSPIEQWLDPDSSDKNQNIERLRQVDEFVREQIESLKAFMITGKIEKTDDW